MFSQRKTFSALLALVTLFFLLFPFPVCAQGTVAAWGWNREGQLGNGTTSDHQWPDLDVAAVPVSDLTDITVIASGGWHSLALRKDGTVWAWGRNNIGQLGDGTNTSRSVPVQVKGPHGAGWLTDVQAIAVSGGDGNFSFSLALKKDGSVWAWGDNTNGQLGELFTSLPSSNTPVQVRGPEGVGFLTGVTKIAAGANHCLALREDGVWAWGSNGFGVLGVSNQTETSFPGHVLGEGGVGFLTGVTDIAGGEFHSLALRKDATHDGTVWAWGNNSVGQLGDGTKTDSNTPVPVLGPNGVDSLTGITALACGTSHSLVLRSDHTVWAWGNNTQGQLGDGTGGTGAGELNSTTPVQVNGLTDVIKIACGAYHSLALKTKCVIG